MPWFVYVLRSEKDGKRYFGCTENVTERIARHNRGEVKKHSIAPTVSGLTGLTEFEISRLTDADAEARETQAWLDFA